MSKVTPIKPELTPEDNNILAYFHCALCLHEKPDGQSPQEWGRLEAGWTEQGLQVWCWRHEVNVLNIDLEGLKVKATTARKLIPGEKKT